MQKHYKIVKRSVIAFSFLSVVTLSAQTTSEEYTDVIIDGKPAKMSNITGEFIIDNATVSSATKTSVSNLTETLNNSVEGNTMHVVKKGETLYALSKQYGIAVDQLKTLNNLTDNTLSVGQELRLNKITKPQTVLEDRPVTDSFWTVKKGETLYFIAKANNLTVEEIKTLNNLSTNTISIGDKLRVKK